MSKIADENTVLTNVQVTSVRRKRALGLTYEIRPQANGDFEVTSTVPAYGIGILFTAQLPEKKVVEVVEKYAWFLANLSGCTVRLIDAAEQIFEYAPDEKFRANLAKWLGTMDFFHSDENKLGAIAFMPAVFQDNKHILRPAESAKDVSFPVRGVGASPAVGGDDSAWAKTPL